MVGFPFKIHCKFWQNFQKFGERKWEIMRVSIHCCYANIRVGSSRLTVGGAKTQVRCHCSEGRCNEMTERHSHTKQMRKNYRKLEVKLDKFLFLIKQCNSGWKMTPFAAKLVSNKAFFSHIFFAIGTRVLWKNEKSVTLSVLSVVIGRSSLRFLVTGDVSTSWLAHRAPTGLCQQQSVCKKRQKPTETVVCFPFSHINHVFVMATMTSVLS